MGDYIIGDYIPAGGMREAGGEYDPPYEFDRYINGTLMAEGVTIERQNNLPDAMRKAARIASRGSNGDVPVLVLRRATLSLPAEGVAVSDAARFLLSRLDEFIRDADDIASINTNWFGHVEPAIARLEAALSPEAKTGERS